MRARVPNFAKLKVKENKGPPPVLNRYSVTASISNGHLASAHTSHHNTVMWHARSFDSGMGTIIFPKKIRSRQMNPSKVFNELSYPKYPSYTFILTKFCCLSLFEIRNWTCGSRWSKLLNS